MASRPSESLTSIASTLVGAASAVVVLGLSATSQSQVDSVFDAFEQTQVDVATDDANVGRLHEAEQSFLSLPGVTGATTLTEVQDSAWRAGAVVEEDFDDIGVSVYAVGRDGGAALDLGDWAGRALDTGFFERLDAVAVVGQGAAEDLGLVPPYGDVALRINGETVTVIGVFADSPREPLLVQSVLVPYSWAEHAGLRFDAHKLVVRVDVGAAGTIAGRAPIVVDPYQPERVLVSAPPTVDVLRVGVSSHLSVLTFLVAGGALIVGAIGISNTALVGVLRRTGELSLRRALGATSSDVSRMVFFEGVVLGVLAGLFGAGAGIVVVVVVAYFAGWTPLVEMWWVPAVGASAGLLGAILSLHPARRAGKVEPADGLRQL